MLERLDQIILILEIFGACAFAISGALVGMRKNMDIFGVCVLGLTTAVGGGVLRDVILGATPPAMFTDPKYAAFALLSCVVLFIPWFRKNILKLESLILLADSFGLGIFTATGTLRAMQVADADVFLAVFVGVITGVGGGLLRDVMANEPPYIFHKHIYALASLAGSLGMYALYQVTDVYTAIFASMIFTSGIRVLASVFEWNLPKVNIDEKSQR